MVFPRQNIQSMEVSRLFLVDTRKTCVTLTLHPASTPDLLMFLFYSGVWEKCPLVRPSSESFLPCEINSIISVPRLYKISQPCAMLGGPRSPTFISISGTSINKNFKTYFHPSSPNFLLVPTHAMTFSPNSIVHMIMENGNPVIAQW
jgi:hypothetical protein